ncbi:MAG: recombinase family protein [Boseongicola sp. SB0662_bin_57]|nr:recombinase family protein [Boseongicola sp. SB0662_bin_57]
MFIDCARVSKEEQNLDLQHDALRASGCKRIFDDKASGARTERPSLNCALENLRDRDTLAAWRLDRLGRSLKDLIARAKELKDMGTGPKNLQGSINTTSSGGHLIFHLFGSLAPNGRGLRRQPVHAPPFAEGLSSAEGVETSGPEKCVQHPGAGPGLALRDHPGPEDQDEQQVGAAPFDQPGHQACRGARRPDAEHVLSPPGLLKRSTVNRWLRDWGFDHFRMARAAPATRFETRHSNACWLRPKEMECWKLTVQGSRRVDLSCLMASASKPAAFQFRPAPDRGVCPIFRRPRACSILGPTSMCRTIEGWLQGLTHCLNLKSAPKGM